MRDYRRSHRYTYLEPSVARALDARAAQEGIPKQMLIRRYLREALKPSGGDPAPVAPAAPRKDARVPCSVYVESDIADLLSSRASAEGVNGVEMIRRCIDAGLSGPPKPQAVTRRYEIAFLRESREAQLREAERAARPYLDGAERARKELLAQLEALRACSPEEHDKLKEELKELLDDR